MHRAIFISSIVLTLAVSTCSKNVILEEEDTIENTTNERLTTTLPDHTLSSVESEFDAKQSGEGSLLILMPLGERRKARKAEEAQDAECKSQKAKRCKTSLHRGRLSAPILRSRNMENSHDDRRNPEYSASRRPRLRLVSLKNPDRTMKRDPMKEERGEDTGDRKDNAAIMKAIREKLQSLDYVGAPRKNLIRKTNVFDDDKYICYCKERDNPTSRKGTTRKLPSKSEWFTEKPIRTNVPRKQFLPKFYPNAHRYLPWENVKPVLREKGIERVPYVPYFYHLDPNLAMPAETIHEANPTKVNIPPLNSVGSLDSIVGQRAPIDQGRDFHNDQQIVEQRRYSPNIGQKPPQLFRKTGSSPSSSKSSATSDVPKISEPHYSVKIDGESAKKGGSLKDNDASDYNLQSAKSQFPEYATSSSIDGKSPLESLEAINQDANKNEEATDPTAKSSFAAAKSPAISEYFSKEYETTDGKTLDYSDVEEVTTAYFTSKAYTDDAGPTSFDSFYVTTNEPAKADSTSNQDYELNDQSRSDLSEASLGGNGDSEYQSSLNGAPDGVNAVVGKGNPFQEQEEPSIKNFNRNLDYGMESTIKNPDCSDLEDSFNVEETTALASESLRSSNEADASKKIEDEDTSTGKEFFAEDYSTESPEMEDNGSLLKNDYKGENTGSDQPVQKIHDMDEKDGGGSPIDESLMKETMDSVDPESDTTIGDDFINTNNENTLAPIRYENENDPLAKSTLKSSSVDDQGGTMDPSEQRLPFCDNALLQKAIKTVINNFATSDSSETVGNAKEETIDSTSDDLLQEILNVPNLKRIVSIPPIERTILDKVKNLLARVTGVPRENFNSDWATDAIRGNLRNTMAAAPVSYGKLPPMTVAEHRFKNGKWVTNLVTLEPALSEEIQAPSDLERLQANVKSILRDPAVGLEAAKQPAIQSMIVQSVRHTFEPENATSDEVFDESVIQGALDREVSLLETEDAETTPGEATETEPVDVSSIDMKKLLEIAKNEAGLNDAKQGESLTNAPLATTTFEENLADSNVNEGSPLASVLKESTDRTLSDVANLADEVQSKFSSDKIKPDHITSLRRKNPAETSTNVNSLREETLETIVSPTTEPFSSDLVGATRNPGFTEYFELSPAEAIVRPTIKTDAVQFVKEHEPLETEKEVRGREEGSTIFSPTKILETSRHKSIPTETSSDIVAVTMSNRNEIQGNTEETVDMKESTISSEDVSPEHDLAYLGKISVKASDNPADDMQSLRNSELYYVGDGVKLPLEIRKLKDGSYALSISRKVCEHLLNKECPCCVPLKGNVVRALKRSPKTKDADRTIGRSRKKRISKRESSESILSEDRRKRDSADDGSQIFSMPVEIFARRYNLSLNLQKVQAPWNFETKKKIDECSKRRTKNSENKRENYADSDPRRNLSFVRVSSQNKEFETRVRKEENTNENLDEYTDAINYEQKQYQRQRNFDKYRYERNIDETVNKRVEIAKEILKWLREVILGASSER